MFTNKVSAVNLIKNAREFQNEIIKICKYSRKIKSEKKWRNSYTLGFVGFVGWMVDGGGSVVVVLVAFGGKMVNNEDLSVVDRLSCGKRMVLVLLVLVTVTVGRLAPNVTRTKVELKTRLRIKWAILVRIVPTVSLFKQKFSRLLTPSFLFLYKKFKQN